MRVEHWDDAADGALNEAAMREKMANWGYRATKYTYPPGTHFAVHTHVVDKVDGVLTGRFELEMDGKCIVLQAGDCLFIPSDRMHSATVIGDTPVVSLDGIRDAYLR